MSSGVTKSGALPVRNGPFVNRSPVTPDLPYGDYREVLRFDFFYTCAYCVMSEIEASAIAFEIDHHEPQGAGAHTNEYNNLMWSCAQCNSRKSNLWPPASALAAGVRYFRPDRDIYGEHFELKGLRLVDKSPIGEFSITALGLNREYLIRLRKIRATVSDAHEYVVEGIAALQRFPLDRFPPAIRGKALKAIQEARQSAIGAAEAIDQALRECARSTLIDPDPNRIAEGQDRKVKLLKFQELYPENWRVRPK